MIGRTGVQALKALLELAQEPGRWRSVNDLATAQALPAPHLEQLLLRLRRAGVLEARRGRQGGYRLACRPENLSLSRVLLAVGAWPGVARAGSGGPQAPGTAERPGPPQRLDAFGGQEALRGWDSLGGGDGLGGRDGLRRRDALGGRDGFRMRDALGGRDAFKTPNSSGGPAAPAGPDAPGGWNGPRGTEGTDGAKGSEGAGGSGGPDGAENAKGAETAEAPEIREPPESAATPQIREAPLAAAAPLAPAGPDPATERVAALLRQRLARAIERELEQLTLAELLFDLRSARAGLSEEGGLMLG